MDAFVYIANRFGSRRADEHCASPTLTTFSTNSRVFSLRLGRSPLAANLAQWHMSSMPMNGGSSQAEKSSSK